MLPRADWSTVPGLPDRLRDPKITRIKDWGVPISNIKKQLCAFLGLTSYYRRFMPNFSSIAAPFLNLLQKEQPERVHWTCKAETVFECLKTHLTSNPHPPILTHYSTCTWMPQRLTPAEQKYATIEWEALDFKWAIKELKYYLAPWYFTPITDHNPLRWLGRAKDTKHCITRWFLVHYKISLLTQHRAGTQHKNMNGQSRWHALFSLLRRSQSWGWGGAVARGLQPVRSW